LIFLLFGPPGAGKGTQSAKLVKEKGMVHVSTGDLFRNAIKNETELGKKAKSLMDAGNLVPDDITIALVEETLKDLQGKDVILDGFPRTTVQAEGLEKILEKMDRKLEQALFIDVDENKLLQRLTGRRVCSNCGASYHVEFHPTKAEGVCDLCGGDVKQRKDDTEAAIKTRLQTYKENTLPLIDYYKTKGIYSAISGEGSTDEVYGRILQQLSVE
tara:strand:+ start:485 stop:1129 length:645 start_codon:yes stop_codon:yes gene_type:complete